MDNINLILGILQWGVFFFFVIVNLLIGFKRGTKKTLYYTLVSIALTVLLFFGISFMSIKMIFRSVGRLIYFVEAYVTIPGNIKNILVNPDLSPFVFAVIDILFKFVLFVVLYSPLKALLTRLIFKPIYDKVLERRKKPIHLPSRFGGAIIGAFRGVFVTIMLLLPIIVISGAFNKYDSSNNSNIFKDKTLIDSNSEEINQDELEDIEELLKAIQTFNNEGIGSLSSKLKFKNSKKAFDEFMFDLIYSTTIEDKQGNKEKLYLSEELSSYGMVIQILIEEGYLKDNFDYKTINYDDNYNHIDLILNSLGESKLLDIVIPFAVDILNDEGVFEKELGFNPKLNPYTKNAYETIYDLKLKNELDPINNVIKELLLIGSVGDLIEITENPNLILDLNQAEKQRLGNILKEISRLEILKLSNILIEKIISDEKLLDQITWEENPTEYLHEHLEFLFNDLSLIQNEILNLGDILLNVFKDEYEDFDYTSFVKDKNINFETLLKEEASKIVSEVILGIGNSKLTVNNIPLLVDFLVYTSNNDVIFDLADKLSEVAKDQNYKDEINNIDNVYSLIVTLGLENLLDNNQNKIVAVDNILKQDGNFDIVKQVINNIFEESKAVNDVLEIISEPLIENIVKDEELKDIILLVTNDEDFKYGKELVNLINLAETIYKFSDLDTIITSIDNKEFIKLMTDYGAISKDVYEELVNNLTKLQTLNTAYVELLDYGFSKVNNLYLEVNENYTYDNFKTDLNLLLGLTYEGAKTLNNINATEFNYKDLNLAEGIDYNSLSELLTFNKEDYGNSIILTEAMNQIRKQNFNFDKYGSFDLPEEYKTLTLNEAWIDEFNLLSNGLIDVLKAFSSEDETFKLSINNINKTKNLNDIPTNRVILFEDEQYAIETFSNLLSSNILKHNIENVLRNVIVDNKIPESVLNTNVKNVLIGENYAKTISTLATLLDEFINDENENLNETIKSINGKNAIGVLNNIDDNKLNRLGYNEIISTTIKEVILNEDIHNNLYRDINKLKLPNELKGINSGIFEFVYSKDNNGNLNNDTFYDLLYFARSLQLPNNILSVSNNQKINILVEHINDDTIDNLFKVKVLHEILSNVLLLDEVKTLGENNFVKVENYLNKNNLNLSKDYTDLYNELIKTLTVNNLIDQEEIKLYIKSYKSLHDTGYRLNHISNKDYNELALSLSKNDNTNNNSLNYLSETKLLRKLFDLTLNDDELLTGFTTKINNFLASNNIKNVLVNKENIKINNKFFNDEGLIEEYLYQILFAISQQDINIINRGKYTLDDLEALIDGETTRLKHIYDVEVLTYALNRFITSDDLAKAIEKQFNDRVSPLNNRLKTSIAMDKDDIKLTFDLVDYDAAYNLIDFVTSLNISNIKELAQVRNVEDFGRVMRLDDTDVLANKLVDQKIVSFVFDKVFKSEKASEKLYNEIIKKTGVVDGFNKDSLMLPEDIATKEEYAKLIMALYGSNLDINIKSLDQALDLLTTDKVMAGNNNLGIRNLLESNIIHHLLDKGLNAKDDDNVNNLYISLINKELRKKNAPTVEKEDELFIFHDSAYDNNGITKDAIVELVLSAKSLGYTGGKFSFNLVTSTIGRNEDGNIDDFDRLYNSVIIKSLVSNGILSDKILDYATKLANKKNKDLVTKEMIKIPESVLDNNNFLVNEEAKALVNALGIVNIEKVSINSVLSIEGRNYYDSKDDLDRVLDSIIIHTYIDRFIKADSYNKLINKELSKVFDKTINDLDSMPETEHLDVDGLFSKEEIRNLFVSARLLDITNPISLSSILSLDNENDDLDLILDADYLRVLLSRLFSHNAIKEMLATGGQFNEADLTLEFVDKDNNENITKEEIKNIFKGLNILEIDELDNISNEKLKSLNDDEMDQVLLSDYLHQVIDLTLKAQLSDDDITENVIDSNGMIKKSEIKSLVELLKILDIDDSNDLSNDITISQVEESVALESALINKLISNVLIDELDIPSDSIDNTNTIYQSELENLVEALYIITNNEDKKLSEINATDNLTTNALDKLNKMDSNIVRRLLSEGIIDTLSEEILIDLLENNDKDVKKEELTNLINSLKKLDIDNLENFENTNFDEMELVKLDEAYKEKSVVVRRLISDTITNEEIFVVKEEDKDLDGYIKDSELTNLIETSTRIEDVDSIDDLIDLIKSLETNPTNATKITDAYDPDPSKQSNILINTVTSILNQ